MPKNYITVDQRLKYDSCQTVNGLWHQTTSVGKSQNLFLFSALLTLFTKILFVLKKINSFKAWKRECILLEILEKRQKG